MQPFSTPENRSLYDGAIIQPDVPSLVDTLPLKPGYYLRNEEEEGRCLPTGQDSPLSSKTLEHSVVGTNCPPLGSETELTH